VFRREEGDPGIIAKKNPQENTRLDKRGSCELCNCSQKRDQLVGHWVRKSKRVGVGGGVLRGTISTGLQGD